MARVAAGIMGLVIGFLVPGLPLGFAFAGTSCPDAGWLALSVGAVIGAVVGLRLARPGPYIRFTTPKAGQFGLSHLLGVVVTAAVFLGVTRALGIWFAAFAFLCIGGVCICCRFGHGLTAGIFVATLFACLIPALATEGQASTLAFWAVVGGSVIASLAEKLLELWFVATHSPSQ